MLGWFKKKLSKKESAGEPAQVTEQQASDQPVPEPEATEVEQEIAESSPVEQTLSTPDDIDSIDIGEELESLPIEPTPAQQQTEDDAQTAAETQPADEELKDSQQTVREEEPLAASEQATEEQAEEEKEPATSEQPEKKKKSFFSNLSAKLSHTRESFTYQLDTLFLGKKEIDSGLLDDLEELLITADLGVGMTEEILDYAKRRVKRKELSDPDSLKLVIKEKIKSFIADYQEDATLVMPKKGPFVIMVVGVNGVGKTTTIGKVAHKFINADQSVLLVAADTFRAAAISQLKIWGERNNVPVYSQAEGVDPSSVVFDGIAHARSKQYDVVLVDTAGRLHTQDNLMAELKKVKRVMAKQLPGSPHEVMLVIDATTGQNGISQAKLFDAAVDITGITLTKLDGTAKGGIVANISRELKTPIRFIGVGEQLEDLRDFDAEEFVEALFQTSGNSAE